MGKSYFSIPHKARWGNHISLTTQSKIYASSGHVNNKKLAPNIPSTGSPNVEKGSKFSISCHSIIVNSNKHVVCFIFYIFFGTLLITI